MENTNLTPEQVVEKINASISEKMAGLPTNGDVEDLKNSIEGLKGLEAKSNDIEKAIAKMEGKMEALTEKAMNNRTQPKNIGEQLTAGYKSQVEAIKEGKSSFNLEVKAPTTITGDYTGNIALSTLDTEIDRVARQQVLIQNIVNRGTTNSKFVTYIQQTTAPSGAFVAEGDAKTEYETKYTEVSKEVKKVASLIKISKEMLEDLPFVQSEVNNDLMLGVQDEIENQLLNGTGLTVNLEGIITQAPTFVAPAGLALNVVDANLTDVILAAVTQIHIAKYTATHVVLNPSDWARLYTTKTAQGEYTYPIFFQVPTTGEIKVMNLSVVVTTWMPAGQFLVGDFSKCNLRMRESMNLSVGYVNDDFQRNMVSILAEARLVSYIKNNQKPAFVKGTIATAITAIDKP